MTDDRKSNATKRYQNSDYPSGSFEAAISVDQGTSGLRLVREPSLDGRPDDDFEEMVPAFMHRDFFRTEEDTSDPVPVVPPTRAVSASPASPPSPSGYVEPPNTEEAEDVPAPAPPQRPSIPTAVIPPRPVAAQPTAQPIVPRSASASPAPPAANSAPDEPLSPLRSNDVPPAPEAPRTASRPAPVASAPRVAPPQKSEPTPSSQTSATIASAFSLPLLAALAMVLGVFVWRESTRPVVVGQQPLPVPQVATVVEQPAVNPTTAVSGASLTPLAIGPPAPPARANPNPTPVAGENVVSDDSSTEAGSLFPGQEAEEKSGAEESEEDADDRAAIMQQMSNSAPPSAPVRVKPSSAQDNSGALFPVDAEPAPAKPKSKPAAPKVTAAKPAAKQLSKPSAADLFPIDDEVPVRRPASNNVAAPRPEAAPLPALSTEPVVAPISSGSGDPYQIDEPNL